MIVEAVAPVLDRLPGCPGRAATEVVAGIAANEIVPPEYVAQESVADCQGVSTRAPVELRKPEPSVKLPLLALTTVH